MQAHYCGWLFSSCPPQVLINDEERAAHGVIMCRCFCNNSVATSKSQDSGNSHFAFRRMVHEASVEGLVLCILDVDVDILQRFEQLPNRRSCTFGPYKH